MLANYHMHTAYSCDCNFEMEEVVKTAISCNLNEICFTDHLDCLINSEPYFDFDGYVKDYLTLKEKYADKITLKLGMEFGMQKEKIPYFENIFRQIDFDFILMSCHLIDNKWLHNQEFQYGKSQDEYNKLYYEEILYLADNYKNYSVIGHLDVIRRYDKNGEYEFEKIKPLLKQIFDIIISDGKGIEINTSSYRYKLKDLMPARDALRLYYNMGGRIITIGSDSHCSEHVSYKLDEVKEELYNIGFREYCTFAEMQPNFHKIK